MDQWVNVGHWIRGRVGAAGRVGNACLLNVFAWIEVS